MIASLKIAAKHESIYRSAAIALHEATGEGSIPVLEKQLQAIADGVKQQGLGPIERAEVIRLFVFRRLPVETYALALKNVAILSIITDVEPHTVAAFVADVYRLFDHLKPGERDAAMNLVYLAIRMSAVPPHDFLKAFQHSRSIALSKSLAPMDYFTELREALEAGIAPEQTGEYLEERLQAR
jgi:hypothetical protein